MKKHCRRSVGNPAGIPEELLKQDNFREMVFIQMNWDADQVYYAYDAFEVCNK